MLNVSESEKLEHANVLSPLYTVQLVLQAKTHFFGQTDFGSRTQYKIFFLQWAFCLSTCNLTDGR